jgi:transcription-repair coupling factor (superfamily II helicase)
MSSQAKAADIFHPQVPDEPGQTLIWSELYGSSFGLAIVSAASERKGPVIIVTEDNRRAQSLEEEIRFYLGQQSSLPLLSYPQSGHHYTIDIQFATADTASSLYRCTQFFPGYR